MALLHLTAAATECGQIVPVLVNHSDIMAARIAGGALLFFTVLFPHPDSDESCNEQKARDWVNTNEHKV